MATNLAVLHEQRFFRALTRLESGLPLAKEDETLLTEGLHPLSEGKLRGAMNDNDPQPK